MRLPGVSNLPLVTQRDILRLLVKDRGGENNDGSIRIDLVRPIRRGATHRSIGRLGGIDGGNGLPGNPGKPLEDRRQRTVGPILTMPVADGLAAAAVAMPMSVLAVAVVVALPAVASQ